MNFSSLRSLPHFRNPRVIAILMFTASTFLIAVMNASAKLASDLHGPIELVFYRGIVALILVMAWAAFKGQLAILHRTKRPFAQLRRSVVGNVGLFLMLWSFTLLPLADATALLFATPLMVTILSVPLLGEKVGPWRWGAVLMGFVGVTMIVGSIGVQGNMNDWRVLVPLAAALSGAFVHIFLRDLGKTENSLTTVFYFMVCGIVMSAVYMPFGGHWPTHETWLPLVVTGIVGVVSLVIKTEAFRLAEASLLSPFNYTAIIWSTMFGWLFWGDLPTLMVCAGTFVIIASNLFILWRENRLSRQVTATIQE